MQAKKKTIGLVTWLGGGNYGTTFQSYALHYTLEKLGYKCFYIQSFNIFRVKYIPQGIITLYRKFKSIWGDVKKLEEGLSIVKLKRFQTETINIRSVESRKQYICLIRDIDVFCSGSDQIWNTMHNFNRFMFLSFARNKKRIAYASSIGTHDIKEEYKDVVKQLLLKYNYIGVRERSAVEALSKLTGRQDIVQVLDPTFLLNPLDWKIMSQVAEVEIELPQTYIFCYLIGKNENYVKQLSEVKYRTNIDSIVIIPAVENPTFTQEDAIVYRYSGPKEFIYILQHATFVCTDSFHASALSINHSKNFVEFIRFKDEDVKSQNSRIYDLLEHYGLTDRIYDKDNLSWTENIDYERVQKILDDDRKRSLDYLVNAIEN